MYDPAHLYVIQNLNKSVMLKPVVFTFSFPAGLIQCSRAGPPSPFHCCFSSLSAAFDPSHVLCGIPTDLERIEFKTTECTNGLCFVETLLAFSNT